MIELPEREALLRAIFASDIGADNEPVRIPSGGYVWYDVTGIDPAREKSLDEVRDQVASLWRDEEVAQRLSEKARTLTERLDKGEAIDAVAKDFGAPVKNAEDLARNAAKDDLSAEAVNRIFAVPVAKAGNVAERHGDPRRVQGHLRHRAALRHDDAGGGANRQPAQDQHGRRPHQRVHCTDPPGSRRHHQPAGAETGDRKQRPLGPCQQRRRISTPSRKPTRRASPALLRTTLVGDLLTPVAAFLKLRHERKGPAFLLESVEGGAVRGRFSMIGLDPDLIWRCQDGAAAIDRQALSRANAFEPDSRAPLESLRALIQESALPLGDELPPMAAGPLRLSRLRHGAPDGASAGAERGCARMSPTPS